MVEVVPAEPEWVVAVGWLWVFEEECSWVEFSFSYVQKRFYVGPGLYAAAKYLSWLGCVSCLVDFYLDVCFLELLFHVLEFVDVLCCGE